MLVSLLDLWRSTPSQFGDKHVQQVVAFAGDGKLVDGSAASLEFRVFLQHVPSDVLARYATDCLDTKFEDRGLALQDVVNEVGTRLGFDVEHGRYRSAHDGLGHDGLWKASGMSIIIEVKTSDLRIELDRIAGYRRELIRAGRVDEAQSSMLLVLGRGNSADLEAQIRGSRYAWDLRLVSVDALVRLMRIREKLDDPATSTRIRDILRPQEFTRVDGIIDLVFSATEEVSQEESDTAQAVSGAPDSTDVPRAAFHEACMERVKAWLKTDLVRQTRSLFSAADRSTAVICTVSREHNSAGYWFAFHPHQKEALESSRSGYIAFGCGSGETVLLVPYGDFSKWLDGMNTTEDGTRFYWHVSIFHRGDKWELHRKTGFSRIDLTKYLLA